ncbi:MAG: hypothetical protein LBC73_10965 [Oscillospiraceae bacterium]|jgi:glycosyltransferase involved in cell wall biosynthesis|nr:hypothetical protein [Oscillospiraceae bacterium]
MIDMTKNDNMNIEKDKKTKVLVLSHLAFSETKNVGKTLSSLFRNWQSDQLAQFYIFNEIPDFDVCYEYYRITDYDILEANIRFKTATGVEINKTNTTKKTVEYENADEIKGVHKLIYKGLEKRMPVLELAREVAWRQSKWMSPEFIKWLDTYNPEVIFILGSNYSFFYKITLWIQQRFNARIFLFMTDDYTFVRSRISPSAWINHIRYMRWLSKIINKAEKLFVISSVMRDEISEKYKKNNIDIITNGIKEVQNPVETIADDGILRFLYAGSVHSNRWKVLCKIGACLRMLEKEGLKANLEIYCSLTPSKEILKEFSKYPNVKFKGSLNASELEQKILSSNVLVHVEAFDRRSIKTTRLSISTKIPEYMMSNRCILAIGPQKVASIQYLVDNDAALCITSEDELLITKMLKKHIFDSEYRQQMANNAKQVAIANHIISEMQDKLYNDILNC